MTFTREPRSRRIARAALSPTEEPTKDEPPEYVYRPETNHPCKVCGKVDTYGAPGHYHTTFASPPEQPREDE